VGFPPPPATKLCGNGIKDDDEDCDGDDLGGSECTIFGLSGGELACTKDCTFDPRACDFAPQPIGNTADLVGGFSIWQGFASNDANGFAVTDAMLIPSRPDAFDRFWNVLIDGIVVNPAAPMSYFPGLVRTSVTAPAVTISGLQVSQRYTTFMGIPVPALRMVLTLTNPTGAPVSVTARATGNFGSDGTTTISGTSNGDTTLTTVDH
jgi:hypothetical protein